MSYPPTCPSFHLSLLTWLHRQEVHFQPSHGKGDLISGGMGKEGRKEGHRGGRGLDCHAHSQSTPDHQHFHLENSAWSHGTLLPTRLLYTSCRTVKFHYPFCKTYGGNKMLEDTPVTANDITEITINIIFNLIKNSISKTLKLQMLTVPGGNQMKLYRCVILWSCICIIENEYWLYLRFLLLFKPGGIWTLHLVKIFPGSPRFGQTNKNINSLQAWQKKNSNEWSLHPLVIITWATLSHTLISIISLESTFQWTSADCRVRTNKVTSIS